MDVQAAVDDVFSLFGDFGNDDYIGEMVSQEQHALQAAHLAETEGFPPEIIIGALLHDIGHLHGKRLSKPHMITDGLVYGICNHEALGLSPASKTTLEHQGGRMTEAEVEVFRKDPKFQAILRMRDWDERAKDPSVVTPSLQHYKDICLAYLSKRCK
ncbi:2-amino-1-hydroxyethylphosphonate dioxygenase (glycine-forming)-like isoform X2 [Macrobrachium rosenbergii]|uniref:2-amino-1-hydroxyethylphosphonate dioxygenase (glycine-forming)-like isoform X2 n=1 Tax=Macrobrachium rosenbergii TaxID=79674 RepID=UPI0034D510AD